MRNEMIIGPDFVWLHIPKCGGTSIERTLRSSYKDRRDVTFDRKHPTARDARGKAIWHHTIKDRHLHDPEFDLTGRKIVAVIRRLPSWLLSRVHYESNRTGVVPTREQFITGRFLERSGFVNAAESMIKRYNTPPVDEWIRVEHMTDDMVRIFGIDPSEMLHVNEGKIDYVRSLSFWFTEDELRGLYEANPTWAELEKKAYGDLLI